MLDQVEKSKLAPARSGVFRSKTVVFREVHDGKDQLTPGQLAQLYEKIKARGSGAFRRDRPERL